LEDGSWLRVRLADGGSGWVFGELVEVDGDVELLNTIDPAEPVVGPMQAFFFRSGIGDAPCAEAPESGILIQTPEGAGTVTLSANEVDIQLGSTIYLQAQPGGDMVVSVIEGTAQINAQGTTVFAPAGTRVRIPITNDLRANGAPIGPEAYDDAELAPLPVEILAREVVVAPALTEAEIEALVGLVPLTGTWLATSVSTDCPDYPDFTGSEVALTVQDGGATITTGRDTSVMTAPGVYTRTVAGDNGITNTITVTFLSPVSATGRNDIQSPTINCTVEWDWSHTGD
jgi:hypothetical protein